MTDPASHRPRRALLLSAYDAQSHRQWRETVCALFPEIEWTCLALAPRHFAWRLRGNSLSWAFKHRGQLTDNHDFLLCTSMTDLSALRGFVPELARLPTAVYFHENQFAYPASRHQRGGVEPCILNLYTALCADELVFNSRFNRDSFLQGGESLLKKLPDEVPVGLIGRLERSQIIPVPLPDRLYAAGSPVTGTDSGILTVAWNHRWEYDKGTDLLLALVDRLIDDGCRFRLHVMGQQFRRIPEAMTTLQHRLRRYHAETGIPAGQWGYVDDPQAYRDLLAASDVILSTALHDFQGLAVLEGAALGATPLAPARMVYPEYLPADCLYGGSGSLQDEATEAAARLRLWAGLKRRGGALPSPSLQHFSASALRPVYAALFQRLSHTPDIR